ncbi:hypothetical protein SO694_0001045 [Aureococcus anophagefferens]|uniref:Exostosin GT47 domain-containing protein n=1 Tax=Aureococcus anophagefferens TaxID=44056 RepID=A0ABR1GFE3_AURAN
MWRLLLITKALAYTACRRRRTGTSIIYLFRRNLLRREISNAANNQLGDAQAHPKTEAELASARGNVTLFEGVKLVSVIVKRLEARATVVGYYADIPSLFLAYEDLVAGSSDAEARWAEVFEFLHASANATMKTTKKPLLAIHQTRPILSEVDNAAAVRDTMRSVCSPEVSFGGGVVAEPDQAEPEVDRKVIRSRRRGSSLCCKPEPPPEPPAAALKRRWPPEPPAAAAEASVMWRLFLTIAVSEGTSARAREAYDFPVKPLFDDEPCPSVYIYDHAAFWPVNASLDAVAALSADDVFGPRCSEAIPEERPTGQYEMAHIVVWRLTRPPRPSLHACRRTTDPALADLFLVPTFPGGEGKTRDWARACAGETDGLASSLKYLDARTAHRHVFLVSKGAPQRAPKAAEDGCDPWWRRPEGLLRRALRFAYSDAYDAGGRPGLPFYGPFRLDDDEVAARLAEDPLDDTAAIPHLHSVPYPSSIHASRSTRTPPWAVGAGAHGASLASFVGETRAAEHLYAGVRPKLIADCKAAPNAACRVYGPHAANRLGERGPYAKVRGRQKWGHFCGLEETYARATFCLEPGGDSPYRKGFYDALATGCIPVVFGAFNARVAPWFVPRGVVVELNETAYLAGDLDVLAFLAAMPADEVSRRQELLAAGAVKVQYALDDVPGDAVETLLRGARRAALDLERARPTLKTWNGSIAQARPAS